MLKTLRKIFLLFFAFLVMGQSLGDQIGHLVGRVRAVQADLSVNVGSHTWSKIGLDSNNVSVGPNQFLIQARITATSGSAINVKTMANIAGGGSPYIHLLSPFTQDLGDISAGTFKDVFYVVGIDRDSNAYSTQSTVNIIASAENASDKTGTRTLIVEKLLSQNQNYIIDSGVLPPSPVVGDTFTVKMHSHTSKADPENIINYPVFNPNMVQLISVTTDYNIDDGIAGFTDNDIWTKHYGGEIIQTLTFKALAVGTVGLFNLIVNQEGNENSSIHYNDDYGQFQNITISPQLSIQKSVDKATANPGDELTYTLNYHNFGNGPANDAVISDVLDTNLEYVSGNSGVYSLSTRTVTFDLGTVAAGADISVSFKAKISENIPLGRTEIKNKATIKSCETDPSDSNEVTTVVEKTVNLTLSKSDTPDPVQAGGDITYTINYANTGNSTAHHVFIADPIPTNTTFVSATGGGIESAGIVHWSLGDLVAGASGLVTFKVTVEKPLNNGTIIENTAHIDSDETDTVYASAGTRVEAAPIFALIKTDLPDPVRVGEVITYTIEYGNIGNMHATNAVISDIIPAGTTYVDGSVSYGGVFDGTKVIWNLGLLTVGPTRTVTFQVKVNENLGNNSVILNHVDLNTGQGSIFDEEETLVVKPVLEIKKETNKTEATPGDIIEYSIDFRNTGGIKENISISDVIDVNLTDITPADGGIVIGNTIIWAVGDLEPGNDWQRVSFTAKVKTPLDNNTVVKNKAVLISNNNQVDSNEVQTIIHSAPILTISKIDDPDPVKAGKNITYTISYANTGNMNASEVKITDVLPLNTTFVSASLNGQLTGNEVIWDLGILAAGASGQVILTVSTDDDLANNSVIENTVVIRSGDSSVSSTVETKVIKVIPPQILGDSIAPIITCTTGVLPETGGSDNPITRTFLSFSVLFGLLLLMVVISAVQKRFKI